MIFLVSNSKSETGDRSSEESSEYVSPDGPEFNKSEQERGRNGKPMYSNSL